MTWIPVAISLRQACFSSNAALRLVERDRLS